MGKGQKITENVYWISWKKKKEKKKGKKISILFLPVLIHGTSLTYFQMTRSPIWYGSGGVA